MYSNKYWRQKKPSSYSTCCTSKSRRCYLCNRMLRTNISAEIMAIPGVDIVVGTQDREKMLGYIEEFRKERQPINAVRNIMKARVYEELDVPYFTDRTRASLKIQEGCNNFCTFCIIPWARGLMRSRDGKEVIKQAQQLVDAGNKEIVLTGIHTGGYGEDIKEYNLAMLLRELEEKVDGL